METPCARQKCGIPWTSVSALVPVNTRRDMSKGTSQLKWTTDFKIGRFSCWAKSNHLSFQKQRRFSCWGQWEKSSGRRRQRRDRQTELKVKRTWPAILAVRRECRWLLETETNPWPTVSKQRWTLILQSHGADFCKQPEWVLKQIRPVILQARK